VSCPGLSNAVTYRQSPLRLKKGRCQVRGRGSTLACGAGVQKVFNSGAHTSSVDVVGTSYARQGRAVLYCINSTIDELERKEEKTQGKQKGFQF
jgi:hypothetical protein